MIVAIDGPAGAGKSTAARAVALRLGFSHMDTGAMYRALALASLEGDLDLDDRRAVDAFVVRMDVSLENNTVTVDGVDVTGRLREPRVTEAVARVAALPGVRSALVPLQRRLAERGDIVVEGRDIGTVVFPDAQVKVYLTASPSERAKRRTLQLGLNDDPVIVEGLARDMAQRDQVDATRAISPLQQADDAHRLDSTEMGLDEVVDEVEALVRRARGGR